MHAESNGKEETFFRSADLPGVEVARLQGCLKRWFHETYSITTVFAGGCEERYRQAIYRTGPGVSMLVEPGEVTVHTAPPQTRALCVVFIAPALVEQALREAGSTVTRPRLTAGAVRDQALFEAFTRLQRVLTGTATRLERQSLLAACLQLLLDRYAEQRPPAAPVGREAAAVRRVRDYIHAYYAENISLDDVAALVGLGRFHLVAAFKREVGLPPHAYHVQVRVAAARRLLAAGLPGAQVAVETGFADQSHMIRHFRRVVGATPGVYARAAALPSSPAMRRPSPRAMRGPAERETAAREMTWRVTLEPSVTALT